MSSGTTQDSGSGDFDFARPQELEGKEPNSSDETAKSVDEPTEHNEPENVSSEKQTESNNEGIIECD